MTKHPKNCGIRYGIAPRTAVRFRHTAKAASPALIIAESAMPVKHLHLCSLTVHQKPVSGETHNRSDVLCVIYTKKQLSRCASPLKINYRVMRHVAGLRFCPCFVHNQDILCFHNIYKNMCNMSCICRQMAESLWIKWKKLQNHCVLAADML